MKGSEVFPSRWLKADDLGDNEPTVIITRVQMEDITEKEQKPVIYFKGKQKGMVCNKTNWNRIAYIHKSDDSDDWGGKEITLYVELVDMQGSMKPAIRVKAPPKRVAIQDGGHVVQQRSGYQLSEMRRPDPIEEVTGAPTRDPARDDSEIPF